MMDFKFKGIAWVGDFYQKFEAVCQEVDDIVGQEAVKYLGNQVQNVGDGVRRLYSDVAQEVLPLPPLVNSVKQGHGSRALNNNVDSPLESVAAVMENKERVEENPGNNTFESFQDSDANNLPNNQHAQASIVHDLVNQVNDEIFSNSCEVADFCTTRKEVADDYFRETSGINEKNLNLSLEQNAAESTPELFDAMSLNEKESLESSTVSESLDSLTTSEVALSPMPSEISCLSEYESLSARSRGSYCSEIDSCKENSIDISQRGLDSSMVPVPCTTTTDLARELMTSQAGNLSCGSTEGDTSVVKEVMPLNLNNLSGAVIKHGRISSSQERAIIPVTDSDEYRVNSIESNKEHIQLSHDVKLDGSCISVDDMELYAASSRVRRLRSYTKRIKDAFGRKKQLEKEYELLSIWYGDSDMEFSEGPSQSSTTSMVSRNLQEQNLCETEWELL